jgi:hypothetical protein
MLTLALDLTALATQIRPVFKLGSLTKPHHGPKPSEGNMLDDMVLAIMP